MLAVGQALASVLAYLVVADVHVPELGEHGGDGYDVCAVFSKVVVTDVKVDEVLEDLALGKRRGTLFFNIVVINHEMRQLIKIECIR